MKECNWCKSEVDEGAKICPKCGKRIWEKKHKSAIKSVGIIFAVLFILLFIIIVILALGSPKVEDKCKNAEVGNLEEIYKLHAEDTLAAEELYKGKYFKFSGTINHKYKNYIQIQSEFVSSDTYFSPNYKEKAYSYNVDDEITYCGKVEFGTAIKVTNTMIIDENN